MGDTKDLNQQEGIRKMKEIAEDARICHFATALDTRPISSRPMSTQLVDDDGNIWFFSHVDSTKNMEIGADDPVQLFYSQNSSSEYLTVYGHAEIVSDRKKIEALWNPIAKAWFPGGKDDPAITLLKVVPEAAHYWDTKHNKFVQLIKIFAGAVVGKPPDDGIEGDITP